jgi:hypothetical protein
MKWILFSSCYLRFPTAPAGDRKLYGFNCCYFVDGWCLRFPTDLVGNSKNVHSLRFPTDPAGNRKWNGFYFRLVIYVSQWHPLGIVNYMDSIVVFSSMDDAYDSQRISLGIVNFLRFPAAPAVDRKFFWIQSSSLNDDVDSWISFTIPNGTRWES